MCLAESLGITYIDSGAIYRAVALWAARQNLERADMHRIEQIARVAAIELQPGRPARNWLNGEDTYRSHSHGGDRLVGLGSTIPGARQAKISQLPNIPTREQHLVFQALQIGIARTPGLSGFNCIEQCGTRARAPTAAPSWPAT